MNEGNVQAIFNRCLATKDTPNSDVQLSVLFKKIMGYDKESDPMAFYKSKIAQNKKNILYLLGQLDSLHRGSREITAKESIYRYSEIKWTTDTVTVMKLYHLAEASDGISPFMKKYNVANKDPTFPPGGRRTRASGKPDGVSTEMSCKVFRAWFAKIDIHNAGLEVYNT